MFWEKVADVPDKLKLNILINPVSFTMICPNDKPNGSVVLTLILIISFVLILLKDLFKVVLTIGNVVSTVKLTLKLSW